MAIRFEWDDEKNLANRRKHGISFERATEVFDDPHVIAFPERIVDGEERWHAIGMMKGIHIVVVAHTFRELDEDLIIRLISARKALRKEERVYDEQNG